MGRRGAVKRSSQPGVDEHSSPVSATIEELVSSYRATLGQFLRNMHGVPAIDCEDLLQEIFARYLPLRHTVRTSPLAYLKKIATSSAVDYHRRRIRTLQAEASFAETRGRGRSPSSEDRILASLDLARVLAAIKGRCLDIFAALLIHGETQAEYAERTCEPLGTIAARLSRCLTKARRALRPGSSS